MNREQKAKNSYVNAGLDPDIPSNPDRRKNVVQIAAVTAQQLAKPSHPVEHVARPMYFIREEDKVVVLAAQPARDQGNPTRFIVELTDEVRSRGKSWPAGTLFECSVVDKDDFLLSGRAKVVKEMRR